MSRSILQEKTKHQCYLCRMLEFDYDWKNDLEEHHVFGGPLRKKSEHYGLKVYLCRRHHRESNDAVHRPDRNQNGILLKEIAQREFEKTHSRELFMKEFGKSYL